MPFGLKFKKNRRYILSQKNSFLVRVQLLDNTAMECTLTLESTGRECLETVATTRLQLQETTYFGLRYLNKQCKPRWVELDKPLKRQMDKYAHEPILYFGVMFYLANVEGLKHEVSRYHYYLQVKCNVIDGLYACTDAEAAELGSYILQAEFGDHDPQLHDYDYFKEYMIFPEKFTSKEEDDIRRLFEYTINKHKRHKGLSPSDAEYNYILKAMHLPGFSQDSFAAKNSFGHDVKIGTSFAGIVITTSQNEAAVCHEWPTIENISHSKNMLTFEIPRSSDANIPPVQFYLEDSDTAKYVWKMCCAKKRFFAVNLEERDNSEVEASRSANIERRPTLRRSRESDTDDVKSVASIHAKGLSNVGGSADNIDWHTPSTDHSSPYFSSQNSLDHTYVSQNSLNKHPSFQNDLTTASGSHEAAAVNSMKAVGSLYSSSSVHSLAQSQMDHDSRATSSISINSMSDCIPLPPYRPSPEYSLAVLRQRRRMSSHLENNGMTTSSPSSSSLVGQASMPSSHPQGRPRPHSMIYSQRELQSNVSAVNHLPSRHQSTLLSYRRSLQSDGDTCAIDAMSPLGDRPANVLSDVKNVGDSMLTGSTPALVEPLTQYQLHAHFTKPPAPYASTPDLNYRKANGFSHQKQQQQQDVPPVSNQQQQIIMRRHHLQPSLLATVNSYNEEDPHCGTEALSELLIKNKTSSKDRVFEKAEKEDANREGAVVEDKDAAQMNVQSYMKTVMTYNFGDRSRQSYHSEGDSSEVSSVPSTKEISHSIQSLNLQQGQQQPVMYIGPVDDYQVPLHDGQNMEQDARQRMSSMESLVSDSASLKQAGSTISVQTLEKTLSDHSLADKYVSQSSPAAQYVNDPSVGGGDDQHDEADPAQSFRGIRQNTIRRVAPMRLSQRYDSNSPGSVELSKGDYDERVLQLEMALNSGNLMDEFDNIPKTIGTVLEGVHGHDRTNEIRPYSESCVTLKPSHKNPRGYINASRVGAKVCGKEFVYIACQTPQKGYEEDLWEMIWNERASIIVCLAHEHEPGKSGVARYWPTNNNTYEIACEIYGEYRVMTRYIGTKSATCLTRNLILEKQKNNEKRQVPRKTKTVSSTLSFWHERTGSHELLTTIFLAGPAIVMFYFMNIFQSIRRQPLENMRMNDDDSMTANPIVVQCATGSGRTAVFILCEILMFTLEHSKVSLNKSTNSTVPRMLYSLRKQRMNFIQTFSQYRFVYQSLVEFLKRSRLI